MSTRGILRSCMVCGCISPLDSVLLTRQTAREKARRLKEQSKGEYVPSEFRLQDLARKICANQQSLALKRGIQIALDSRPPNGDIVRRRARMLLQSAGWLDIDKFIEHRPPISGVNFWKRPMAPQLGLQSFDGDPTRLFYPVRCALCRRVVRGSMFQCTVEDCKEKGNEGYICRDCQHEGKHTNQHLTKHYKHCILNKGITSELSRQICQCGSVPRYDGGGHARKLFPINKHDSHRKTPNGAVQCGLLQLGDLVGEAKYDGILLKPDKKQGLAEMRRLGIAKAEQLEKERRERKAQDRKSLPKVADTITEKKAGEDIPFFVRKITDQYPFGNVHMALRVGPLMIENGVQHTQSGVLITSRDPPQWQSSESTDKEIAYSLAVSQTLDLYSQQREKRAPKRYKTALKQVVGGIFSGFVHSVTEDEIINMVMDASALELDHPEDDPPEHKRIRQLLTEQVERIMRRLNTLMGARVNQTLEGITEKLLDPTVDLKWNKKTNNCQILCDNLIDHKLYGGLVAPTPTDDDSEPLYLMSFVCRPEGYNRHQNVETKYDVPWGLCEEYLLKFRYGLHVDSDIIDLLQEYWHDWGAFGGPLYPHQHLFPWDCTEAYGRSSTKCGECNISKHVWSFPFDSWSMIELHLSRTRLMYPEVELPLDWTKNRISILLAQDVLITAAKAMAESMTFRKLTSWISQTPDPQMDRLKLGGIHRAQPFSHQYEEGQYHEYFIAHWAHLPRDEQIALYETARNHRNLLADLPAKDTAGSARDGGDDWSSSDGAVGFFGCEYLGAYYVDGWDGSYSQEETMGTEQAGLVGTTDSSWDNGGDGGYGGGDGGGDGGGCGGGCGGGD